LRPTTVDYRSCWHLGSSHRNNGEQAIKPIEFIRVRREKGAGLRLTPLDSHPGGDGRCRAAIDRERPSTVDGVHDPAIPQTQPLPMPAQVFGRRDPSVAGLPVEVHTVRRADPEAILATRQAFPDVHVSVGDMIAEGDRVMSRDTARATHRGDFQGIPATGRQPAWTELHFFRIQDGRIAEHWANFDQLGILVQMGAIQL
jgi:predicted ester cyclase